MKDFYITVSNGLLETKHYELMGQAVWLFMWFLDHMTSISEEGVGKVLGGRPIKHEDIISDINIPRQTFARYISILKKNNYIETKRTPYGLIISVNKAQKVFNQKRCIKNDTTDEKTDVLKMVHHLPKNDTSLPKNDTSNKTRQLDKTITTRDTYVVTDVTEGKRFNALLFAFKPVNPNYEKFFANKNERKALQELVDKYGFDKMENLLRMLPELVIKPYAPRITTPICLQRKMGDLILFMKQKGGLNGQQNNKRAVDARHL